DVGASVIELHTGGYADTDGAAQKDELQRVVEAAAQGADIGLTVHAGHGLHYENVGPIAVIPQIVELNIGHAIVARAIYAGFPAAVSEMKHLMAEARQG
ncbi:MAG: pyridoxine 5'-phosphate synthase, partial [Woeseiaceae bacterium]|nr:pyridoxine 5'-phosphate synthase [Woeseiaceae bacterium]